MPPSHRYYIDFTTDLQRIIHCLINKNVDTARIFLIHANHIYLEQLKKSQKEGIFSSEVEEIWLNLWNNNIPATHEEQLKYADKIQTLSSIIFHRTYQNIC